jgi:signal transduction histidine kinase
VRVHPVRPQDVEERRRRVLRLERLPLRPVSARLVSANLTQGDSDDDCTSAGESAKARSICELDPGWAQWLCRGGAIDSLVSLAETRWWPRETCSGEAADVLGRLWRHSVAVGVAARRLAHDHGDRDPDAVGRAGLLSRLGWWAIAACDVDWLVRWWHAEELAERRRIEAAAIGTGWDDLGRRLAERWRLDPLVIDAAWLHGEHGRELLDAAHDPVRLEYIEHAHRWVEQTPLGLARRRAFETMPSDPRLRILVAEVQSRASAPFVAPDATPYEERLTQQNARLRLKLGVLAREQSSAARILKALSETSPAEAPEEWAARAALAWCEAPELSSAQVIWVDESGQETSGGDSASEESPHADPQAQTSWDKRPPTLSLPFAHRGRVCAYVHLWSEGRSDELERQLSLSSTLGAWESWTALIAERSLLDRRLERVTASFREYVETADARLEKRKLDALAEFAAGAGHELNNPLAVVVGRAQLLLTRTDDPEVARSIGIILNQARRAHRILRDLMFVARPAAPRCRTFRPAELLRASMRDHEAECAARGIRLSIEVDDALPEVSSDPDALRHLNEILLRNAIDATPSSGSIEVRWSLNGDELACSVADTGKGFGSGEAAHLLDPFYCGRQAGRGLGLGLARAARIAELAGGSLRWSSAPGHGAQFHARLPIRREPEKTTPLSRS